MYYPKRKQPNKQTKTKKAELNERLMFRWVAGITAHEDKPLTNKTNKNGPWKMLSETTFEQMYENDGGQEGGSCSTI